MLRIRGSFKVFLACYGVVVVLLAVIIAVLYFSGRSIDFQGNRLRLVSIDSHSIKMVDDYGNELVATAESIHGDLHLAVQYLGRTMTKRIPGPDEFGIIRYIFSDGEMGRAGGNEIQEAERDLMDTLYERLRVYHRTGNIRGNFTRNAVNTFGLVSAAFWVFFFPKKRNDERSP